MFSDSTSFAALYQAALRDEPTAKEQLFGRYRADLGRWIRRRLGYRAVNQWEDVLQDTLCEVLQAFAAYPDSLSEREFRGYLFQTAKYCVFHSYRKVQHEENTLHTEDLELLHSKALSPGDEAGLAESICQIVTMLRRFDAPNSTVLRDLWLDGQSVSATAARVGLSEHAVRKRRWRGRAKLRQVICREFAHSA